MSAVADPLIGTVVGDRYRILERIGVGGMATVYRGEHQLLRKGVAIKILLPEIAVDGDMAARFESEAVAAAKLDHPNCVGISDFGRTPAGRLYLVMELIDGVPLSDLAGRGTRLPWERAIEIARQLLRGLARAHELGVVHRDLKPSNIMISSRPGGWDIAKIIDFGIAKVVSEANAGPRVETKAGTVFGTADFIAPERLLGGKNDDPRSDLYAVGVILYEMLCGTRPFHDEDAMTIIKRAIQEQPRSPGEHAPDAQIPARLEQAVLRALEKDPDLRYQDAKEFLTALDADELRTSANPVVAAATAALQVEASAAAARRRRTVLTYGGAGAALFLVLLAVVLSWGGGEAQTHPLFPSALAATGDGPAPPAPELLAEVDRLVKQAAEGETVELRQSAADRLVALGFGDKVPMAQKLSRDLHQLATCEARLEVLGKLEKLRDPETIPSLRAAAARPDNDCLSERAQTLVASLSKKLPEARPTRDKPIEKAPVTPTRQRKPPAKKSGGGGHF